VRPWLHCGETRVKEAREWAELRVFAADFEEISAG
jgi:hypothetical protein